MGTLGKFKKNGGLFEGTVEGISFGPSTMKIMPIAKPNPEAPDYRVYRGQSEVGAGWRKKTKEGVRYLVLSLDDPSFPSPLKCRLVPDGDDHTLFWTRP